MMSTSVRPQTKRRVVSAQAGNAVEPARRLSTASPSPFASTPMASGIDNHRPFSKSTISMAWGQEEDVTSQQEVIRMEEECIETKTVVTTTTTKRSYPPFSIRKQPLSSLNPKEYPLSNKEVPAELRNIAYDLIGYPDARAEDEYVIDETRQASHIPPSRSGPLSRFETAFVDEKSRKSLMATQHRVKNGIRREERAKRQGLNIQLSKNAFPVTPDTSELEISNERARTPSFFAPSCTPRSGLSRTVSLDTLESPAEDPLRETFARAVATPPVAESDLEAFIADPNLATRPTINTAAAQNASLPSPGLSPSYISEDDAVEDDYFDGETSSIHGGRSQELEEGDSIHVPKSRALQSYDHGIQDELTRQPSVIDMVRMEEAFDTMPNDLRSIMMFKLLQRCSRKTLYMLAEHINPVLKCDFLGQLPTELSLHIVSFMDHRDLCRAAQVSRKWRALVDTNESGWKELFDRDGFVLPMGELERAIKQGWGWQDPYGVQGVERDLSVIMPNENSDAASVTQPTEPENARRVRSSTKRKRNPGATMDRSKRRAISHEFASSAKALVARYMPVKFKKPNGPLTAASAAIEAVPHPPISTPELRQMHLFKSLYRRHYMLRASWTSGKVEPHHFAFPAHPTHVITCLQFDDDKILTGSDDTMIHVYDTRTGALRQKLEGHEGGVWALQYEGNVLVSGSTDRSVRVWDIEKGLCTQVFHGHTSTVRCLQILMPEKTGQFKENGKPIMLPERPLIITGSRDSQLRVWKLPEQGSPRYNPSPPAQDTDCPYFVRLLAGHTHSVRAIAAQQDTLVSGSYDHSVRVWKISTGEVLHKLTGHSMKVYSVVLDHQRNRCVSGSMDNYVKIWSLDTGACLYTLEGHISLVGLLDLRDSRLVSAAADATLRVWDPQSGLCKNTLTAHTSAITCFQHDGQKVISGSDRTLKMWDIQKGECIKDLLTDLSGVWQVKFDARRCVAAVQRDGGLTYVEVIDFGASRDGVPLCQRQGRRVVSVDSETRVEEVDDV